MVTTCFDKPPIITSQLDDIHSAGTRMTIKLFKLSLLIIISHISIINAQEANETTPLLPEVKAILDIQLPTEQEMNQNAYIYLSGMMFADDNYHTIAKNIILDNIQYTKNKITLPATKSKQPPTASNHKTIELNREIAGESYDYPCNTYTNLHCIDDILNKPELSTLLANNQTLLQRYQTITQLPFYKAYYQDYQNPFRLEQNWMTVMFLSSLNQIKAIQLIEKGEIDAGLTILQNEMAFYKKILISNGDMVDQTIAMILLSKNYHTIEQLLDLPIMRKELNNPLLTHLFKPLTTKEQQAMGHALSTSQTWQMYSIEGYGQLDELTPWLYNDYIELIEKANLPLTYNKNKTLNASYQQIQKSIDEGLITLPKASSYYLSTYNLRGAPKEISIERIIQTYGSDNIIGGIEILDNDAPQHRNFIYRLYNVSGYLALITAKLEIKQANITKQQVPDFLKNLGEKGINPYTQKPFIWNEQQQTLSTDWLDLLPRPPQYGKQASVYIAFP